MSVEGRAFDFETPGRLALRFRLEHADVVVETGEDARTEIVLDPDRDDEATRDALAAFVVRMRRRGDGSDEIEVEEPRRRRGLLGALGLGQAAVTIRVRCPEGASLELNAGASDLRVDGELGDVSVRTGSGDVTAARIRGTLSVASASGDVRADEVRGEAAITTASGDVTIELVHGRLRVNAVSGDVRVREARAGAAIGSVSGDVRLSSVSGGDVDVKTVSGDAEIGVPAGVGVWVDASSVSGSLGSELDLEDGPPVGGGESAIELRARTVSGDLRLARAAAARAAD